MSHLWLAIWIVEMSKWRDLLLFLYNLLHIWYNLCLLIFLWANHSWLSFAILLIPGVLGVLTLNVIPLLD